ncbi:hypothetical protein [Magnetospirillum aberrantis]|uniref:Uncharacterized protein n=1 Tax=Magnetospirillum aberrantis SpK TaxID=908842 RepID=A0A7C9QTY7_9PROT|nr:hypothetical protein [Magnetospirillum aberrantis]NFV80019.1 hypothetical protein [Magnetospirillum aberrantis SpK]
MRISSQADLNAMRAERKARREARRQKAAPRIPTIPQQENTPMAKGRKSKAPPPSLSHEQKLKIIADAARDIIRIKAEMKALAGDITAARGRVKQTGVKASDFATVFRLFQLEAEDRDKSLDGLVLCAEALDIDLGSDGRQGELFGSAGADDARRTQDPEPGSIEFVEVGDEDGDDEPSLLDAMGVEDGEANSFGDDDADDEPVSDWAAAAAADDEAFDAAGVAYNAAEADGKEAGFAGAPAEANPHEAGSVLAAAWEKGRLAGSERSAEVDQYNSGWEAHKAGQPREANPNDAGTEAHDRWALGWDERQKKVERAAKAGSVATAEPATSDAGAEGLPFVPGDGVGDAAQVAAE